MSAISVIAGWLVGSAVSLLDGWLCQQSHCWTADCVSSLIAGWLVVSAVSVIAGWLVVSLVQSLLDGWLCQQSHCWMATSSCVGSFIAGWLVVSAVSLRTTGRLCQQWPVCVCVCVRVRSVDSSQHNTGCPSRGVLVNSGRRLQTDLVIVTLPIQWHVQAVRQGGTRRCPSHLSCLVGCTAGFCALLSCKSKLTRQRTGVLWAASSTTWIPAPSLLPPSYSAVEKRRTTDRRDQEEGGELDSYEEAGPEEIKSREVVLG